MDGGWGQGHLREVSCGELAEPLRTSACLASTTISCLASCVTRTIVMYGCRPTGRADKQQGHQQHGSIHTIDMLRPAASSLLLPCFFRLLLAVRLIGFKLRDPGSRAASTASTFTCGSSLLR
jgi:hypothetical protein